MEHQKNRQDQSHYHKIVVTDLKTLCRFAVALSQWLNRHCIILLEGTLGSGKTTLVQYLCQQLSVREIVNSPTFIILNQYHGYWQKQPVLINHFDFYRLHQTINPSDRAMIDHYLQEGINLIEWPLATVNYHEYCNNVIKVKFTTDIDGIKVVKWRRYARND